MKSRLSDKIERAGWSVAEWAESTGFCRASVYNLMDDGKLRSAKVGAKRVILDSPREFLERYATEAA